MARTPSTMIPLGTPAPDFDLPDTDGQRVQRTAFAGQPLLVIFTCNHCPFVVHVRDALSALVRQWQARGLAVVAIASNDEAKYPQDGPAAMRLAKAEHALPYPYLFDATQQVALAYHAACTPDFFLFDRDHHLVYRGQLDASRPGNGVPVTGVDLAGAIDDMFAGRATETQRPSMGCNIKWREENMAGNVPAYPLPSTP